MGHLCILLRRPDAKAGLTAPNRQEGRDLKFLSTCYVASPVLGALCRLSLPLRRTCEEGPITPILQVVRLKPRKAS